MHKQGPVGAPLALVTYMGCLGEGVPQTLTACRGNPVPPVVHPQPHRPTQLLTAAQPGACV